MLAFISRLAAAILCLSLGTTIASPGALAQATTNVAAQATLAGTVTDTAGKALAHVAVRIAGPTTYTSTTDDGGRFSVVVAPAIYDVAFSRTGFSDFDAGMQAVLAGETRTLTVSLSDSTLTSLRTIGRVTSRSIRPSLNTATSAVSVLPSHVILDRESPDLAQIATELPGITQSRGGQSPNSDFVVRGALNEANTAVDGHIIRAGNFGALLTTYIPAQSFGSIETTKGPGQFGPTSGDSVFGTLNFRTPDFAPGSFADVTEGYETEFGSAYSSYLLNTNLLADRLSLIAQFVADGADRPGHGTTGFASLNSSAATPIVRFGTDFSTGILQRSELLKARYKLSDATSLTAAFFGVQGLVRPQGGSYARNLGTGTIYPCLTTSGPGVLTPAQAAGTNLAVCDQYSAYNPPAYQGLALGTTPITQFGSLNPSSLILDNEPQFEAEFRTTIGKDTLLIRPAFTLINRTIDGANEASVPGLTSYGGGKGVAPGAFYLVTNSANCTSTFTPPNTKAGTGASGPCFQGSNANPYTTATNPCSAANPCYAAVTTLDAAGRSNFGTPFNQTQVDKDRDIQVTYSKSLGPHSLQFGYDYNSDDNSNFSGDPSSLLLKSSTNPVLFDPTGFQTVDNSIISYPRSIQRRNDFQLSAQLQLGSNVQLALGNYYTNARLGFGIVDPVLFGGVANAIATKDPRFNSAAFGSNPNAYLSALTAYVPREINVHHNDPQIGLTITAARDLSIRLSGGSSTFVPYAGQVGGRPRLTTNTTSSSPYPTENIPNPNLKPETTVGYDVGADVRYPNGIFSFDLFDNTIHDKLTTFNNLVAPNAAPIPLPAPVLATSPKFVSVNQTFNAPVQRTYGLELNLDGTREDGFGYRFTGTFERAYFDLLPASFYVGQQTTIINGAQIPNNAPYSQAYGELNYHQRNGFALLGGLQYTGANNQTLGPAYTIGFATLRLPVAAQRASLQFSIDNLFNYTTAGLGGSLNNSGIAQVQYGSQSQTGTPTFSTRTTNLQFVEPRTFRVQLSTHIGKGAGSSTIGAPAGDSPATPATPAR